MTGAPDRETTLTALTRALPYIRLYRDRTFVVKVGGAICGDVAALRELAAQLSVLAELSVRLVLVHGGGPQTTALAARLDVPTTMVNGRRVTDERTLELSVMSLSGTVSTTILSACRAVGLPAVGLSGVAARLLQATRRPPQRIQRDGLEETVDFGLVGDLDRVEPRALQALLEARLTPVVSPLSADDSGQVLNVNADTAAAAIACALRAEKLIFMTDTAGLLADRHDARSLISYTDLAGLARLEEQGAVDEGMLPKSRAAREALQGGVHRVHLVGYRTRAGLLAEIFTNEGAGTLVVKEMADLTPAEQQP